MACKYFCPLWTQHLMLCSSQQPRPLGLSLRYLKARMHSANSQFSGSLIWLAICFMWFVLLSCFPSTHRTYSLSFGFEGWIPTWNEWPSIRPLRLKEPCRLYWSCSCGSASWWCRICLSRYRARNWFRWAWISCHLLWCSCHNDCGPGI